MVVVKTEPDLIEDEHDERVVALRDKVLVLFDSEGDSEVGYDALVLVAVGLLSGFAVDGKERALCDRFNQEVRGVLEEFLEQRAALDEEPGGSC